MGLASGREQRRDEGLRRGISATVQESRDEKRRAKVSSCERKFSEKK